MKRGEDGRDGLVQDEKVVGRMLWEIVFLDNNKYKKKNSGSNVQKKK